MRSAEEREAGSNRLFFTRRVIQLEPLIFTFDPEHHVDLMQWLFNECTLEISSITRAYGPSGSTSKVRWFRIEFTNTSDASYFKLRWVQK